MNKQKGRKQEEKVCRDEGEKEQSREKHSHALGNFLNFLQHPTDFT